MEIDEERCTPLHFAVLRGEMEKVKHLLSQGANPNFRDIHAHTPVYRTIMSSHPDQPQILRLLIQHGANIHIIDNYSESPLYSACFENKFQLVKIFLEYHANSNVCNLWKQSPLHAACLKDNPDVVEMLLKSGAEPNARDAENQTPLYVTASRNSQLNIAKLLIQYGANPFLPAIIKEENKILKYPTPSVIAKPEMKQFLNRAEYRWQHFRDRHVIRFVRLIHSDKNRTLLMSICRIIIENQQQLTLLIKYAINRLTLNRMDEIMKQL